MTPSTFMRLIEAEDHGDVNIRTLFEAVKPPEGDVRLDADEPAPSMFWLSPTGEVIHVKGGHDHNSKAQEMLGDGTSYADAVDKLKSKGYARGRREGDTTYYELASGAHRDLSSSQRRTMENMAADHSLRVTRDKQQWGEKDLFDYRRQKQ